jgi:hypothetical protein
VLFKAVGGKADTDAMDHWEPSPSKDASAIFLEHFFMTTYSFTAR